ncbi:MAG: hypothetical protein KDB46_08700 [Solirubrobacterales bacterium]|nr:hypothetical protein [Solirubrobacterales bacterium]
MPAPTFRVHRAAPVLLCACLLALTMASLAEARPKTTAADLRVVDSGNRTLTEGTQLTGPVKVKTDPKATCFGPGTGGSGDRVSVPGSTALGQLANAGKSNRAVSPLGITDFFDFGLGICRIGSAVSPQSGYWYLKVDHEASFSGADQTKVRPGDEILWYLIEDYNDPVPDELVLRAPATADPGRPFEVEVISRADDGEASPAAGASVTGADAPTDDRGRTTVTVDGRTADLVASRAGSIVSNEEIVCTRALRNCPAGYATTVAGTGKADRIRAGKASERILAGGGKDRIDARRGKAPDRINCGPGRDRLVLPKHSGSKYRSCERVKHRG